VDLKHCGEAKVARKPTSINKTKN